MLRDLTIQNYRCFKDFHIYGLASVNLIVGMNNSGKTSLLEAVYLLVNQNRAESIAELLSNRGEITEWYIAPTSGGIQQHLPGYQIRHIFRGHQFEVNQVIHIQSQQEHSLSVQIDLKPWSKERIMPLGFLPALELSLTYSSEKLVMGKVIPVRDDGAIERRTLESEFTSLSDQLHPHLFLSTNNLSFNQLAALWDKITLTPEEEKVVTALRILDPAVERIGFTSRQTSNSGILLKLRGQDKPIPLSSMGEGMRRILTLAMAAVTAENGFLLVDEIETGLYYETQTDMWRLILEIAQQLNVQVFATTHSWDCIAAFQEALDQIEDSSVGKLFRLSRKGENIRAVDYPAEKLGVAVRQSIEVR